MAMIAAVICIKLMIFPKALHSLTISDVTFTNGVSLQFTSSVDNTQMVGRGSITPFHFKHTILWPISTESQSLKTSHSNPSFQSAPIQTALSKNVYERQKEALSKWTTYGYYAKNDYVMERVVLWLLAILFSVLSINHSVKIDRITTNLFRLFMVIRFMTDVQAEIQMTKLLANDTETSVQFGYAVSNYDDMAIIGTSWAYNDNGDRAGAAYIFERSSTIKNEWKQISKLTASDGREYDYFGRAVSIYGQWAVVGAEGDNNDTGAVYVFYRQNGSWSEQSKLIPSDAADGDYFGTFGHAVSIHDTVMAVGAWKDDGDGDSNEGSVYIFEYNESDNEWTQSQKLKTSVPSNDAYFGTSVAVYNDTVIIGADELWYIFERDMDGFWNPTHHEIGDIDYRHIDVDIYEHTVVIGDWEDQVVYIYTKENGIWSEAQTLTAGDSENEAEFGCSVSIYDDILVIGAREDDGNEVESGSIYIFTKQSDNDSWIESTKIVANDGELGDYFGAATSIHDDIIFIGANYNEERGAVYTIKNWDSCYSIWNETENKQTLLNDTDTTSYLINYEWNVCNFAQFTMYPTMVPTDDPTKAPTTEPTAGPTTDPTSVPTSVPTMVPIFDPTSYPTNDPTSDPTNEPTSDPTKPATTEPTTHPIKDPTANPTSVPTNDPTKDPTKHPTMSPSLAPTISPSNDPTYNVNEAEESVEDESDDAESDEEESDQEESD